MGNQKDIVVPKNYQCTWNFTNDPVIHIIKCEPGEEYCEKKNYINYAAHDINITRELITHVLKNKELNTKLPNKTTDMMELTVITSKIVDGKPSPTDFNVTRYRDSDLIGTGNDIKGADVDTIVAEKLFQFAETNLTST